MGLDTNRHLNLRTETIVPAGPGPHAPTAAVPQAESLGPAEREPRFAERRRIAVLEHDRALRPVVIRTLLRLGCVVSAKHEFAQVTEALQAGPIDGAVVALGGDGTCLPALQSANASAVPIVVLLDQPVEPHLQARYPALRFLQKPFDMRELLAQLGLPEKATILYSE
jgi:hypothetical protein